MTDRTTYPTTPTPVPQTVRSLANRTAELETILDGFVEHPAWQVRAAAAELDDRPSVLASMASDPS